MKVFDLLALNIRTDMTAYECFGLLTLKWKNRYDN